MTRHHLNKLAIIAPVGFALSTIIYHLIGNYWSVEFQQAYSRLTQLGFMVLLLWIVAGYLPKVLSNVYRWGFTLYFFGLFIYRVCKIFGVLISDNTRLWIWTFVLIIFIIFALYLLSKKDNDLYLN